MSNQKRGVTNSYECSVCVPKIDKRDGTTLCVDAYVGRVRNSPVRLMVRLTTGDSLAGDSPARLLATEWKPMRSHVKVNRLCTATHRPPLYHS